MTDRGRRIAPVGCARSVLTNLEHAENAWELAMPKYHNLFYWAASTEQICLDMPDLQILGMLAGLSLALAADMFTL